MTNQKQIAGGPVEAEASDVPRVQRLFVYPIKSLDGVERQQLNFTKRGGLDGDRRFAIFDSSGKFINAKREARLHLIRASFSDDLTVAQLEAPGLGGVSGELGNPAALEEWLGDFLGQSVELRADSDGGFPDDNDCPGPTILATASLKRLQAWLGAGAPDLEELIRRFRANVMLGGCPPFFEDSLMGDPGGTPFYVGETRMLGVRASARCAVPARDTRSAESTPGFQKTFVEHRRAELPAFATESSFDHFYRLALNTRVPAPFEARISVGDEVRKEFEFSFEW